MKNVGRKKKKQEVVSLTYTQLILVEKARKNIITLTNQCDSKPRYNHIYRSF